MEDNQRTPQTEPGNSAAERARRRQMRRRVRLFMAAILGAMFLYLGVQLYPLIVPAYQTETAIRYTLADGVQVQGVAVRSEAVLASPDGPALGYLVEDGSRVSAASVVAEAYASQQASQSRARELSLTRTIEMLQSSQDPAQTSQGDVEIILAQQQEALLELLKLTDSGRYGQVETAKRELTQAANRLQVATGQVTGFDDLIAQLTSQRDEAAAAVGQVNYLTTPSAGYFSSTVDGMEGQLTCEALDAMSATEFEELLKAGITQTVSGAGKIVSDYKWYYYCLVPADQVSRFESDRDGAVTIDFSYTDARQVPATIVAIHKDDTTGQAVVKLECTYINASTIDLRFEEASVNFASYTGLRINRNAAHIVDGEWGVYIKYGNLVQFKRIDPLYENEDYMLLPVQSSASSEENQVVLYDEVIVSGRDLYDGKLIE